MINFKIYFLIVFAFSYPMKLRINHDKGAKPTCKMPNIPNMSEKSVFVYDFRLSYLWKMLYDIPMILDPSNLQPMLVLYCHNENNLMEKNETLLDVGLSLCYNQKYYPEPTCNFGYN
ncbi:hypothetical protein MHBO_000434 [Bonamia ostreae]|uniref:Uncharacterized protein n=1 Tax=Bonamia ostreae TaxID=126728 RepID=A0ABV2AFJ8_9EUKA